jgi:hypothetical protein
LIIDKNGKITYELGDLVRIVGSVLNSTEYYSVKKVTDESIDYPLYTLEVYGRNVLYYGHRLRLYKHSDCYKDILKYMRGEEK